jgi:ArsR family transcriptional regulator
MLSQFDYSRTMKARDVVPALAALPQENRLEVFRLLVQTGAEGLPAGRIADRLKIASPTLSFHLAQLKHAGLVEVRREGRSLIYAAHYGRMNALMEFLRENCCASNTATRR